MTDSPPRYSLQVFTAGDGYPLRYRRYDPPVGSPRGHVVCIHGVLSHAGWYEQSCCKLSEAGYSVSFLDRRGAGMNDRARGDTPSFRRLVDDLAEFLDALPGNWDGTGRPPIVSRRLPRYLIAISWGGKLALALEKRRPGRIDGMALLCPGIFSRVGLSLREKLGIAWARVVSPGRLFRIPLTEPELFTATPRWQDFIRDDPLCLRKATARFLSESVRLDWYVRLAAAQVRVPVLLMLAEKDQIIDNTRTRRYFKKIASHDKSVLEYENAHHTLEFESDPEHYLQDLLNWLNERSTRLSGAT